MAKQGTKPADEISETELWDAVLKAAKEAGGGDLAAYLKTVAKEAPGSFLTLLARAMPEQATPPPAEDEYDYSKLTDAELDRLHGLIAEAEPILEKCRIAH